MSGVRKKLVERKRYWREDLTEERGNEMKLRVEAYTLNWSWDTKLLS